MVDVDNRNSFNYQDQETCDDISARLYSASVLTQHKSNAAPSASHLKRNMNNRSAHTLRKRRNKSKEKISRSSNYVKDIYG